MPEILSFDEVVARIAATMLECSSEDLEKYYTEITENQIISLGDSMFEVIV